MFYTPACDENKEESMRRYKQLDVTANKFYQMPQFLFSGDMKSLSNDARVLYTLMRNRHDLSLKNHWMNEKEEVYIVFAREDMADMLGCSQPTLRKIMKELEKAQLLEEERQGMNLPNLIYLNYIDMVPDIPPESPEDCLHAEPERENTYSTQSTQHTQLDFTANYCESTSQNTKNPDETLECKNLSLQTEKNLHSGVKETYSPDCKNLSPSYTNTSYTESSYTHSIYQSFAPLELEEELKEQFGYEGLLMDGYDGDVLLSVLGIAYDFVRHPAEKLRVNGAIVSGEEMVRTIERLEPEHIAFVIESLGTVEGKIRNMRSYILTALYNARRTMGLELLRLPMSQRPEMSLYTPGGNLCR